MDRVDLERGGMGGSTGESVLEMARHTAMLGDRLGPHQHSVGCPQPYSLEGAMPAPRKKKAPSRRPLEG